ncbi:MAG: LCP family protein [Oscillospiraceae bacterium]|nr:LCP family protein [Oscillospiraceae bacterium]
MEEELLRLEKTVKNRNRRRLVIILCLVAAVLGAAAFSVWRAYDWLFGGIGDLISPPTTLQFQGDEFTEPEETDPNFESLHDISDATNLNGFLREWWYNGGDHNIRYSKDVVNVLLIGQDYANPGTNGRSDTMMLCSVNKKTRTITLVSFLRDSYAYLNIGEKEYYHRFNSALMYGGPEAVMDAISHLYKVKVDHYAMVDFKSFPKLIDALGGVTLDVEAHEARYINRTAPSMKNAFPFGEGVQLNGKQALVYSRIRKLDSDIERTARQQKIIEAIVHSARDAGNGQLLNAVKQLLPYVLTNYSEPQLMSLATQAVTGGWARFGMAKASYPIFYGENFNCVTGTINGMQILIVDYPLAAQQLQTQLYGESNIDLSNDANRSAYIQSLFRSAQQQTRPRATTQYNSSTTQPAVSYDDNPDLPDATEAPVTTTAAGGLLPWLFGSKSEATEAPPQEAPPEG